MNLLPALATVNTFRNQIVHCDALTLLRSLPPNSVHCAITSPPYYGLRDYGSDGQIGLENTPEQYVNRLVSLFRELRRVLRSDGTLWLNLGDSYGTGTTAARKRGKRGLGDNTQAAQDAVPRCGGPAKQLLGIPWRVAFALQDDGWYLRSEITWCKTAPMPESVRDRPTSATEKVFLFSKRERYFYDYEAVKVPSSKNSHGGGKAHEGRYMVGSGRNDGSSAMGIVTESRNLWNYWLVGPEPNSLAHFATFPQKLIEPMILAGCPKGGIVIDMFSGSGTTALVARRWGRDYIGCDLNPEYVTLARNRLESPYMVDMFAAGF